MNHWTSAFFSNLSAMSNYLVYAAIAIVTLIGVLKCLLPLWRTTSSLRRAVSHLQEDAGNTTERPVWQEPRFVGKRLKGSWMRFLQNAEQLDRRGLPCNVEDYINDDTVTHGPGNAQLAELIPSLLTSLGILGTFIGMTSGLSGLDVSSTDSMMAGIQTLLAGMQFAFGTSVAGVACSLIFNMLNRIAQGSSYRAIDDFVDAFTQLAMQRPLDNDVQVICQNQDTNHLLSGMNDTLSTKVATSVEMAVGRALSPVSRSMDSFLIAATRAQVDGVNAIVDSFVRRMNDSLSGQFLQLGKTLSELNQGQHISFGQMNQSLQNADKMLKECEQMTRMVNNTIQTVEHHMEQIVHNASSGHTFAVIEQITKSTAEQAESIANLQAMQHDMVLSLQQSCTSSQDASVTISQSNDRLVESYQQLISRMVDTIGHTLDAFDKELKELTQTFSDKVDAIETNTASALTSAQISQLQTTLAAIEKTLRTTHSDSAKED